MRIAVLGLGEAGAEIAADLAVAGDEVHAYDPGPVTTPEHVTRHHHARTAVEGCGLVLAVTPGSSARDLLTEVVEALAKEALYADLSTAAPAVKSALAEMARPLLFADVALMSPVPGRGLSTPAIVSGSGAAHYADLINARGGNVEFVEGPAGEAAQRKLLRSVVMKGLAGVLMEAMEAAQTAGKDEWMWDRIVETLTAMDAPMLRRLVMETPRHAARRREEMEAARELLSELEVPSSMTDGTIARLERLIAEGLPRIKVD
jgi:3-hydroxyisobutyrate dehydrogenase-like beta-hydroxyacid dehydrogenase